MKPNKNKLLKLACICSTMILISCNKNTTCTYETSCQETAPAGYMVGTMGSHIGSFNRVATIFRTANNASAPVGDDWNEPLLGTNRVASIFPKYWVSDSIGQVFGIALDHSGGIFLSATDVYRYDELFGAQAGQPTGYGTAVGASGGPSGIYYTNYATPNITTALVTTKPFPYTNTVGTAKIPNSGIGNGNSIGNIAYDYANKQLFATNLEDGRIYRINPSTGVVLSIFDPFALDGGTASPGMAPLGEQLWGIGVLTQAGVTTVYFARTISSIGKQIWSIQLDASGEFMATAAGSGLYTESAITATFKQPIATVPGTAPTITDIAFSSAGRMLLAERGHPHIAKVFEYVLSGSTWVAGNNFYPGTDLTSSGYPLGANSAGGVDYSNREVVSSIPNFICNDIVWASGNAMFTKTFFNPTFGYPNYVYGVQGMSSAGNSTTSSINAAKDLYIDYNCTGLSVRSHTGSVKGRIGDVEFFDPVCPCK